MKLDDRYPDKADPLKLYPANLIGPHPEVAVTPVLRQSWRSYPCIACGTRTGWRLDVGGAYAPVCSDDCAAQAAAG